MDRRVVVIRRIINCSGSLFYNFNPKRESTWLSTELTMPQLKALMCVVTNERATSGQIARRLGVGLSTITGIVDRLAEQNLVARREDPHDRRITRVLPTEEGRTRVDELLRYRQEMLTGILARLDDEQLHVVETAFSFLVEAATEGNSSVRSREQEEVVA